jgi:hypothetical protein
MSNAGVLPKQIVRFDGEGQGSDMAVQEHEFRNTKLTGLEFRSAEFRSPSSGTFWQRTGPAVIIGTIEFRSRVQEH